MQGALTGKFVDIRGCPPISVSPTEIWGSIIYYQLLLIKCAIYIRPRVDPGIPDDSDGQKYG